MKYYKILKDNLNMRWFQYKEGLNIDTHEIDNEEWGNGLHFSDAKNIFKFIDYGNKIADVEIPENAIVYQYEDEFKADKIILSNIRYLWHIDTIKELVEQGADIHIHNDYVLLIASKSGYLDIVKYLVEEQGLDIHAQYDYPLELAVMYDHLDVVKYLIENGADIHTDNDHCLQIASEYGYSDIVEYLIKNGANTHADNNNALLGASKNVHLLNIAEHIISMIN